MKKLIVAILVFAIGFLLPQSGESAPAPKPSTGTQPVSVQPQYGGILKVTRYDLSRTWGYPPEIARSTEMEISPIYMETLISFDMQGRLAPKLATAWEYSKDLRSLTLTLREGVKFHDGTNFNAAAAKYNLDLYINSPRIELKSISSIDVVDDYTVRLNLSKFDASLLSNLAEYAGLMASPTAIKTNGKEWCAVNAVGTGPFKLVSVKQDISATFTKFDSYWQKGKPYLDGIEIIVISEPTTMSASLQKGEVDIGLIRAPEVIGPLKEKGFQITPVNVMLFLISDSAHANSPFKDVRVRQAVCYAIDYNAVATAFGYGFWPVTNQPATPDSLYYNSKLTGYPYNPKKAKELLAAAGYPNGFQTTLFYVSTPANTARVTAYQGFLSKVGIQVRLEGTTQNGLSDIRQKGWENGLVDHGTTISIEKEPGFILRSFFSRGTAFYQVVDYPDEYQAKLATIYAEPDAKKRIKLNQELLTMFVDKYCILMPAFFGGQIIVKSPKVHDTRWGTWAYLWTPADAWLSK